MEKLKMYLKCTPFHHARLLSSSGRKHVVMSTNDLRF